MNNKIRIGFVGVNRSSGFLDTFESHPAVTLAAFCDIVEEQAVKAAEKYGAQPYTDYEQMLENANLDGVVVSTPMQFHAPQSIQALQRNIHVLSEVTAATDMDQCHQLVKAAKKSEAYYMFAENYCYTKPNLTIDQIVQAGHFGEIYFAEGEYTHELKELNEETPWRRKWQTGVNGCTYGTHSLGPILWWLKNQRVTSVSCIGTGNHYTDPRGDKYEMEDVILMLCRLSGGGLAKIRVDLLSNRPHSINSYTLQGTDGAYESARSEEKAGTEEIWLKKFSKDMGKWDLLSDYDQFVPKCWQNPPKEALEADHWGGDYFIAIDFIKVVQGQIPPTIDIHQAMDMTLPGLISQQSIQQGSIWLDVPDSRDWV